MHHIVKLRSVLLSEANMVDSTSPPSYEVALSQTELKDVNVNLQLSLNMCNDNKNQQKAQDKDKMAVIFEEFEISQRYWEDLTSLDRFDIVFVCDDSGSMRSNVVPAKVNPLTGTWMTRWDQLQYVVKLGIRLGT